MIAHPSVKVNLGLSVLRKRPDGYHDLETLFLPCAAYSDTLEIVAGDDWSRTSARLSALYGPPGDPPAAGASSAAGTSVSVPAATDDAPTLAQAIAPDGKCMVTIARREGVHWSPLQDLCARAYALLDADFQLPPVKIYLEKTTPVGAGLGGGSADAAAALKLLNELFALSLTPGQLAGYAARLGSDCPFFVYERPMLGEGRGEILTPFDIDLSGYELQVIVPECISVSTAEAYRNVVPREKRPETSVPLKEALSHPVSEWKDLLVNDFEESVFTAHPALAAIKQSLYDSGAVYASLSGSGSALFALYPKG